MPLRTQIKAIAESLPGNKTYLFGTAKEINAALDNTGIDLFVTHYPVTPITISPSVNGSMDNSFELYIEFLYLTKFEQNSEDDEELVNRALLMANTFLVRLRDYVEDNVRYFDMPKGTSIRAMPTYNRHDANTTGVCLTFKVGTRQYPYLLNC